jgi:hypothetical protein
MPRFCYLYQALVTLKPSEKVLKCKPVSALAARFPEAIYSFQHLPVLAGQFKNGIVWRQHL